MELVLLEDRLLVASEPTGVAAYDFDFALHFASRHPYELDPGWPLLPRIGATDDYASYYRRTVDELGVHCVNSPDAHAIASELPLWYPLIEELTARSRIYERLPDADEVEREFGWPVFLKGARQTSKHNPDLAAVRDREHYLDVCRRYRADPILHWQSPVLREFLQLQRLSGTVTGKIAPSLEFRSFWWNGRCVGWGPYWYQLRAYRADDEAAGIAMAAEVARRLSVPFLVVDLAKTVDGRWVVIECNDAQESGHAGIAPQVLWRNLLDAMKS